MSSATVRAHIYAKYVRTKREAQYNTQECCKGNLQSHLNRDIIALFYSHSKLSSWGNFVDSTPIQSSSVNCFNEVATNRTE